MSGMVRSFLGGFRAACQCVFPHPLVIIQQEDRVAVRMGKDQMTAQIWNMIMTPDEGTPDDCVRTTRMIVEMTGHELRETNPLLYGIFDRTIRGGGGDITAVARNHQELQFYVKNFGMRAISHENGEWLMVSWPAKDTRSWR